MAYEIANIRLQYLRKDPRFEELQAMKKASGLTWEVFILKVAGIAVEE